jgi:glycine cleavage system H protein
MEGFAYNNIFETKGIEYIIIIFFLVIIIPFWFFINKQKTFSKQISNVFNVLSAGILKIPQGLYFSKNHTWAHLEKSGEAKVGLDDFLLKITGYVNLSQLKLPGETIQKGDVMAEITQNGKRLQVTAPISGKIVNANVPVCENAELLNDKPYENGWLYSIKPGNWKNESSDFYLAEDATVWMSKELERFKDFLNISLTRHSLEPSMLTLQEGGELRLNPLAELEPEIWEDFQKEFLILE